MAVLGSERHESRRIDNQLRGRSGRQGDPGFSLFFVSFEDDLMIRYGSDRYQNVISAMGDEVIESKTFTKLIGTAQKRVEGVNFDIRKSLLEYDDVLRQQREIIYDQRNFVLENDDVQGLVKDMFDKVIANTVLFNKNGAESLDSIAKALELIGFTTSDFNTNNLSNYSEEELVDTVKLRVGIFIKIKLKILKNDFLKLKK